VLLVPLQLAAESHVGALQAIGEQGSQAGQAHQHEGHAHQGIEDGRQLPGGGARRQAAVTCKDRNDISGLELKHGKHEQANINACTFNRMGEDKWRNGCGSFWKLNLW